MRQILIIDRLGEAEDQHTLSYPSDAEMPANSHLIWSCFLTLGESALTEMTARGEREKKTL
jgi:hypothetical protein